MNKEQIKDDEIQIGDLIREDIDQAASSHSYLMEGLEDTIVDRISEYPSEYSFNWIKESISWFLNSYKLKLTAAGLIILVAGIFIGIYFQGIWGGGTFPMDSNRGVWFVVAYPEADQVSLAGDFTDWQPKTLNRKSEGLWAVKVNLAPGRYEYNFIVNNSRWVLDPRADEYAKSFGTYNSVIYVGRESA